jgi:hypothetical protein
MSVDFVALLFTAVVPIVLGIVALIIIIRLAFRR